MVDKLETRVVAGQALLDLGEEYPDLVVLGGDLNKSTHANKFGAAFPDRFFDFGPAEQNIVSVAAGMAASGKVPVVSTFAVFATSRPYDQLRVGVAQSSLNVKVIATHAGIITGEDGVSAHSIEDIAIACGVMVHAGLEAAEELGREGIDCRVLNMSTVKPLDSQAVLDAAGQTGAIVTAEEHYVNGGLGSAVAQLVSTNSPVPVECVALPGYAESGTADELLAKQGLTPSDLKSAVIRAVGRKG